MHGHIKPPDKRVPMVVHGDIIHHTNTYHHDRYSAHPFGFKRHKNILARKREASLHSGHRMSTVLLFLFLCQFLILFRKRRNLSLDFLIGIKKCFFLRIVFLFFFDLYGSINHVNIFFDGFCST